MNAEYWPIDSEMKWDFPMRVKRCVEKTEGPIFESHWHDQFQLLYFVEGEALLFCNSQPVKVARGDLIVINGKEVHYGENLGQTLVYYSIKFDFSVLFSSQSDLCHTKYITPLMQNQILFRNKVGDDKELLEQVRQLIEEYQKEEWGYELAVKSLLYRILFILMRRHGVQSIDEMEQERRRTLMHRLLPVLDFVEQNYREQISLVQLARIANMTPHHLCRLFKKITGKPPKEYINYLRINHAAMLLTESNLTISEIAAVVGIDDSNYFSRVFKKYKKISPSELRR